MIFYLYSKGTTMKYTYMRYMVTIHVVPYLPLTSKQLLIHLSV